MKNATEGKNSPLRVVAARSEIWERNLNDFAFSLFLTPEWVRAMAGTQAKRVFLDFVQDDTVVAKVSGVLQQNGWLKGRSLLFYASPALRENRQDLLDACCTALLAYARSKGIQRILMASYDQQHSMAPGVKGWFVNKRCEFVVPLNGEGPVFSTNFKRNVKKALKKEALFGPAEGEDLQADLEDLLGATLETRSSKYGETYNPFYLPLLNSKSLERLYKEGAGRYYKVTLPGAPTPNCVLFNLEREGRAFNLLVGSDSAAYRFGLAGLADYQLIESYRLQRYSAYNLGGATGDAGSAGLERSKEARGGQRRWVYGATTNFLCFPHRLLNPLLLLLRRLRVKLMKP